MVPVMPPVAAIRHVIGVAETTAVTVGVSMSHAADIDRDISLVKIYRDLYRDSTHIGIAPAGQSG